jgi:hypothetical protein
LLRLVLLCVVFVNATRVACGGVSPSRAQTRRAGRKGRALVPVPRLRGRKGVRLPTARHPQVSIRLSIPTGSEYESA